MKSIFSHKTSKWSLITIGSLLGLLFGIFLLDLDFITGNSIYWVEPYGDSATNLVGLIYFVKDTWRFPLFMVPALGIPEGANIIFTDSVPLIALFTKIIYKLTGQLFNPMGFWILACFTLSGAGMASVMTKFQQRNIIVIVLAVVFALCAPILLVRLGHASLMSQFLILFSLSSYLTFVNSKTSRASLIQFTALACISLLIQAYFFPIVIAFFAASLVQRVINGHSSRASAFYSFFLVLFVCIFVMFVSGFISFTGTTLKSGGYGHYSMNLLSPFIPARDHMPEIIASLVHWDGHKLTWDATGGQYEGYAYLGMGVIGLLILSLIYCRKEIYLRISNHLVLTYVFLMMFFYALSDRVYLGDYFLIDIHFSSAIGFITDTVRTGGRMFWPIYYTLVVFLFVLILRRFNLRLSLVILTFFTLIQIVDTNPQRKTLKKISVDVVSRYLDNKKWDELLKHHDFVIQIPSHQCGGWASQWPDANAGLELMLLTAKRNIPINSAYLARHVKNCSAESDYASQLTIEEGGLYVFLDTGNLVIPRLFSNSSDICRSFDRGIVCTSSWNTIETKKIEGLFSELKQPMPIICLVKKCHSNLPGNRIFIKSMIGQHLNLGVLGQLGIKRD